MTITSLRLVRAHTRNKCNLRTTHLRRPQATSICLRPYAPKPCYAQRYLVRAQLTTSNHFSDTTLINKQLVHN
jgi:hypothetical protein